MQKSKIDRILEWVESLITTQAGANDSNIDLPQQDNNSMTTVSEPIVNDNEVIEQQVATVDTNSSQEVWEQVDNNSQTEQQPEQSTEQADEKEEDFDKIYEELMNSFAPKQPEPTTQEVDEPVENVNYKELYEQERQKNYLLEWEKKELTWQANYFKNSLDKEWEKQRELMDKIKGLEAQIRTVSANSIPENFVPLTQTYNLWQETKIPAHKWRAVKEALTIVENMTGVPASDYYNQIIKNESPDIPEVNDNSSTTSKLQQNKQFTNGFVML